MKEGMWLGRQGQALADLAVSDYRAKLESER